MELNYHTVSEKKLLPPMLLERSKPPFPILHFGVGAFHRSHQAWALQQLIDQGKEYVFISNIDNLGATVDFSKIRKHEFCVITDKYL